MSIPLAQEKLAKQLKGIKIDVLEHLNCSESTWMHLQYLDEWVNGVQRELVMNEIDWNILETVEVVGFKLTGSALTTYNDFRSSKGKIATLVKFMIGLHDFLIASTRKDSQ